MSQVITGSLVGIVVGIVVLLIVVGASYLIVNQAESVLTIRPEIKDTLSTSVNFARVIVIITLAALVIAVLLGLRAFGVF